MSEGENLDKEIGKTSEFEALAWEVERDDFEKRILESKDFESLFELLKAKGYGQWVPYIQEQNEALLEKVHRGVIRIHKNVGKKDVSLDDLVLGELKFSRLYTGINMKDQELSSAVIQRVGELMAKDLEIKMAQDKASNYRGAKPIRAFAENLKEIRKRK